MHTKNVGNLQFKHQIAPIHVCVASKQHVYVPVKRVTISFIINGHKVHHHNVQRLCVQAADAHLKGGKHATARLRDDHLGALLVEFVPQRLRFERCVCLRDGRMVLVRFLVRQQLFRVAVMVERLVQFRFVAAGHRWLVEIVHVLVDVLQRFVGAIFAGTLDAC